MKYELKDVYVQSDKGMMTVILFLFVFSLTLANWHDTWSEVLTIGTAATIIPIILIYQSPGSLLTRISIAFSFMVFSALEIHQARGVVELHFGILAFLYY